MTDQELRQQFRRCQKWNDPDQWEALGFLYQAAGYNLNRNYCWRKADELRQTAAQSGDRGRYVNSQWADLVEC